MNNSHTSPDRQISLPPVAYSRPQREHRKCTAEMTVVVIIEHVRRYNICVIEKKEHQVAMLEECGGNWMFLEIVAPAGQRQPSCGFPEKGLLPQIALVQKS